MSKIPRGSETDALKALLIEASLLHHHVASATRLLARPGDLTHAQVSLLRSLAADGPRTVPHLARERAIARQPVQRTALELEDLDLVTFEPNPRHRRSHLVTLTAAGRRRLTSMERRQSAWTGALGGELPERGLRSAARLLRRVREQISTRAPLRGNQP